jgi:predicted PurR-regulated permease PerM
MISLTLKCAIENVEKLIKWLQDFMPPQVETTLENLSGNLNSYIETFTGNLSSYIQNITSFLFGALVSYLRSCLLYFIFHFSYFSCLRMGIIFYRLLINFLANQRQIGLSRTKSPTK